MGDPKKTRKKYETPYHPWQKARIVEEKELQKEYGFKNKQEIWKATSQLRRYKSLAKKLVILRTEQAEKERIQLLNKLSSYGWIDSNANLSDVLGIQTKDILERRLQTLVLKKGYAKSIKQARQFITHHHIKIGENKITAPSYLVTIKEEPLIVFAEKSKLGSIDHPERAKKAAVPSEKPSKKNEKYKQKKDFRKKGRSE